MTKSILKPLVLGSAVAAALAVLAAPAYAVEAKISGQVNRALMQADDGVNSELLFVDNDNSSTRFRFTGSEDIGSGLKMGIVWEVEMQGNDSNLVTPLNRDTGGPTFGERKSEVYIQGAFGQFTLGQGDGAMNGGIEVDLSGTSVISYSGTTDIGGAIAFVRSGGGATTTIGGALVQQDFESRYDRLRYDSPKIGPVTISVSTGTKSSNDVQEYGVWGSQDLGAAGKLAFAVGFSTNDFATNAPNPIGDQETTGGSISWLHPSGWNVTFATSNVENDAGKDSDFNYIKVGYMTGKHAFSIDFARGEDQVAALAGLNPEAEHFGFQYVYTPTKAVELYAGYKSVSLDADGASFEDITVLTVGSRIKF